MAAENLTLDRCNALSAAGSTESATKLALQFSVDKEKCSVSFNEFLAMNSKKPGDATNPTDLLLEIFEMFDTEKSGSIPETVFKNIMMQKADIQKCHFTSQLQPRSGIRGWLISMLEF